jgi:hypothetical protein
MKLAGNLTFTTVTLHSVPTRWSPRGIALGPAPAPAKRPAIQGTKTARLLALRIGARIDPSSRLRGFTLDPATGGPDAEDADFDRVA